MMAGVAPDQVNTFSIAFGERDHDESPYSTAMARRYGRCRRGERLRMSVPHGHWKTTTLIAGLRRTGLVAPMVLDGPVNGE